MRSVLSDAQAAMTDQYTTPARSHGAVRGAVTGTHGGPQPPSSSPVWPCKIGGAPQGRLIGGAPDDCAPRFSLVDARAFLSARSMGQGARLAASTACSCFALLIHFHSSGRLGRTRSVPSVSVAETVHGSSDQNVRGYAPSEEAAHHYDSPARARTARAVPLGVAGCPGPCVPLCLMNGSSGEGCGENCSEKVH